METGKRLKHEEQKIHAEDSRSFLRKLRVPSNFLVTFVLNLFFYAIKCHPDRGAFTFSSRSGRDRAAHGLDQRGFEEVRRAVGIESNAVLDQMMIGFWENRSPFTILYAWGTPWRWGHKNGKR